MANDNKKINDLVSESEDDTSELAVLSEDALNGIDIEFEADAATQAFDALDKGTDPDNDSIAALRSELRERDENIDRLEFELQQIRSRSKGIEAELDARKELTGTLAGELEQQKHLAGDLGEQLRYQEQKASDAQSQVRERDERISQTESQLEAARKEALVATTAYEDLEKRHAVGSRDVNALRIELGEEQARRKWAEDSERDLETRISQLDDQCRQSQELAASLQDYVEARKSRWDKQESDLKSREQLLREQGRQLKQLSGEIRQTTTLLEKEKSSREDAEERLATVEQDGERLRSEVSALNRTVKEKDAAVVSLQSELEAVQREFADTAAALGRLEGEHRSVRAALDDERNAVASLREELATATTTAAERDRTLDEQRLTISDLREHNSRADAELAEARATREVIETQFEESQTVHKQVVLERDSLAARLEALQSEAQELRTAAAAAADREQAQAHLAGLVASQESAIEELREQIGKTEGYADTLRDKLQQQLADGEAMSKRNRQLEDSVEKTGKRLAELSDELDREKRQNAELSAELETSRQEFEREIRTIRLELDAAQETVADGRNLNEQLTADLAESTGHRQALEARLSETDELQKTRIRTLSDELARLKLRLEDYEQKLAHKDAAVKALLNEFASKPKSDNGADSRAATELDSDDVGHRLTVRKGAAQEDSGTDRDRVTRLLVGTIDGQKLRFPLFKPKLTIGRTSHNDIQIKAQFISRRHAVVVTEDEQTRIVDWGSKNGVYVNGIRVTEKGLRNGDLVTVGTAEFVFEERPKR